MGFRQLRPPLLSPPTHSIQKPAIRICLVGCGSLGQLTSHLTSAFQNPSWISEQSVTPSCHIPGVTFGWNLNSIVKSLNVKCAYIWFYKLKGLARWCSRLAEKRPGGGLLCPCQLLTTSAQTPTVAVQETVVELSELTWFLIITNTLALCECGTTNAGSLMHIWGASIREKCKNRHTCCCWLHRTGLDSGRFDRQRPRGRTSRRGD